MNTTRAAVAACWLLCGCLPDAGYKQRGPTEPEALDDGWEIASPQSVGLDPRDLADIHEQLLREDRNFGTLGMLVIKDRKLVWETYLRSDEDRDQVHALQSATKSVTATAFGIARAEGLFPDLDATLRELIPEALDGLDRKKGDISLRHLLTMRSGIDFDNSVFSVEILVDKPRDPLRYILEKPLYADPGERFYYRDADPQLLGYVLQHETGEREEDWVRERLFEPLGIEDYYWESAPDGATLGPYALHLRPRDFAKLGQFWLDGCTLNGEPIAAADFCAAAMRTHVSPKNTGHAADGIGYGYYFWTVRKDGLVAAAADGHGGQFVLVVPAKNMVLVQIARPDTDDLHGGALRDFVELTAPLWQEES